MFLSAWLKLFAVYSYKNMGIRRKMKEEFAGGEESRFSLKTR